MNTAQVIRLPVSYYPKGKPAKPSKTFQKYLKLLNGVKPLAKGEILGLAWVFNGRKSVNITPVEKATLWTKLLERNERNISRAQTDFGIKWLKQLAFKANGEPREYKDFPFDENALHCIKTFKKFAWIGFHNTQEDFGNFNGCKTYTPVWRTYARDGSYFDYYVIAGGPGGSVQIVIS